ncbi:MAG: hypothetical protein K2Y71_27050 [Xanthobacteraceae bacterium]|nr:hypothetical protein [Xanthobacteraceae bacterium]
MSAPVQRDESFSSDDARLYAPPWARERPLPAAGQPQFTSSPPVASANDDNEDAAAPKERARMPRGVGGPNITWAPKAPPQEAFTGDVAIQALRRRLTLEPDAVPQPPIVVRREAPFPWIARLGFVCLAAGLGAFCITALSVTDLYSPAGNRGDRSEGAGGFTPTTQPSGGNFELTSASLVVPSQGGRAAANDPLPLGVTLKDSSGGETVFLSGLENGTRLTAGTPYGSKGWRISARDLGSVMAYAPIDYIGAMHAAINLHAANNAVVDTRVVKLEWIPKVERQKAEQQQQQQQQQKPEQTAAVTPRPVVAAPQQPRLDQEEIGRLIKRGQQLLASGDIAPARLLLQRAANGGSAEAALILGGTYDPDVLREIGVLGFAPNPAMAREWYQKALELGANEASRRLDRLAQAKR